MSAGDKPTPEAPDPFYSLSHFSSGPAGVAPVVPARKASNPLLRQQAEEALRIMTAQSQEHIDELSPETLRTILHELRVHQIELEMQNEELRQAQAERPAGLALVVFEANHAARAFYERHGFRAGALRPGTANEEGVPDVRYDWRSVRSPPSPTLT